MSGARNEEVPSRYARDQMNEARSPPPCLDALQVERQINKARLEKALSAREELRMRFAPSEALTAR